MTDNSEYEDDGLFNIPEPEYDQEEEGLSDKDDICVGDDMPNDGLSQEDVTGIENDPRFEKTIDLSDFDIQYMELVLLPDKPVRCKMYPWTQSDPEDALTGR